MSNKAITWAYDLPLKGPAKPVLVALADYADEEGTCYPGQDRLAVMTGLSKASVRRALERLEELGLIRREHRYDKRGYRTSDRYRLSLDTQVLVLTEPNRLSATPSAHSATPSAHSEHLSIRRTLSDPSGGAAPTPDPVDNPEPAVTQKLGDGGPLVPWCKRHAATEGHDGGCAACKRARLAWEQSLATASQEQQWHAVPTPKRSKHWREGLCEAHLQPEATCEACAQDRKRGVA